jgi:alcohol oxidase
MNDKADFAPIRWSYKVTRELARRMDGMLPFVSSVRPF